MRSHVAKLRVHGEVDAPGAHDLLVRASIGPEGELMALWCSEHDHPALTGRMETGFATFPESRASRPVSARVVFYRPTEQDVIQLLDVALAHPLIQPLPDDRILIAGARCGWHPEGPENNAAVYGADGSLLREGVLGDGIEHLRTTTTGDIWVGYFDEGIFGNYGWGGPDGPEPVGSHGLVRFSADLRTEWRFPVDSPYGSIDDCYALNVVGNSAWACYYSDFPIVRIEEDQVTWWHQSIHGARALMVDGDRVALVGGYRDDRDRLVVGRLGAGEMEEESTFRLGFPGGAQLPADTVIGSGEELNVVAAGKWYKIALSDLRG